MFDIHYSRRVPIDNQNCNCKRTGNDAFLWALQGENTQHFHGDIHVFPPSLSIDCPVVEKDIITACKLPIYYYNF